MCVNCKIVLSGDGVQTKRRTCTVPGTCLGINLFRYVNYCKIILIFCFSSGHDSEQVSCNAGPCPQWSEWAQADPCPMTCGRGTTVRRRQCTLGHGGSVSTGCIGDETRTEPCQSLPPCCQPWSPWSSCSTTCGQGVQTRKMTCDAGPGSTEQQPCSNPQPCCSEWSQWGGCQVEFYFQNIIMLMRPFVIVYFSGNLWSRLSDKNKNMRQYNTRKCSNGSPISTWSSWWIHGNSVVVS